MPLSNLINAATERLEQWEGLESEGSLLTRARRKFGLDLTNSSTRNNNNSTHPKTGKIQKESSNKNGELQALERRQARMEQHLIRMKQKQKKRKRKTNGDCSSPTCARRNPLYFSDDGEKNDPEEEEERTEEEEDLLSLATQDSKRRCLEVMADHLRDHLQQVDSNASYLDWLKELHPENVQINAGTGEADHIDARFFIAGNPWQQVYTEVTSSSRFAVKSRLHHNTQNGSNNAPRHNHK